MIRRAETIDKLEKSLVQSEGTINHENVFDENDEVDLSFTKILDGRDLFEIVKRTSDAEFCAKRVKEHIFEKSFAQIQENYYARKVPSNIIDSMHELVNSALEMEYLHSDMDDMDFLAKKTARCDDEPITLTVDTWARSKMTKHKKKKVAECGFFTDKGDGVVKEGKKNFEMAVDLAQKYLKHINNENIPKPIELHEKPEFVSQDELKLRLMKEKQLKEEQEKNLEKRLRDEKIKAQQKEIGKGAKDMRKKNITYDFHGNMIVINPIHHDKLHNVVIDSKHAIKHSNKDVKDTKLVKKEIPVEKISQPGIKSNLSKQKMQMDDLMKSNYTAPPQLQEVFEMADGVTITENGKQKQGGAKKGTLIENGKTRMNKTQFTTQ